MSSVSSSGPPTPERSSTILGEQRGSFSAEGSAVELDPEVRETIEILVADDERSLRESCASVLRSEGFPVTVAASGEEAIEALRRKSFDIALVDLYMPEVSGMEVLQAAVQVESRCLVIMMTGQPSVESSIDALRDGAWSYLPKPFSATHLTVLVGRAAHAVVIGRESRREREAGTGTDRFGEGVTLLGRSEAFKDVVEAARQVASTDASVFITGESGTGKELIAHFIHENSSRSSRDLVPVNSAAIPESLLESEMFGHVEGAFTGAVRDKEGLLEVANGGTLFLDEITEMPLPVQAKLLRVVQDGVVRRVGSTAVDAIVNVRFIAATHRDSAKAVQEGLLRKDLHYRLRVFPIHIPPLRERPEDIEVLAEHFLDEFWETHRGPDLPQPTLTSAALKELESRRWSGNVRELGNVIEHAVVLLAPGSEVKPEDLPSVSETEEMEGLQGFDGVFRQTEDYRAARERVLGEFERNYLRFVIARARGNVSKAARIAGVDRTTLYRLMEKHDLEPDDLTDGYRR